MLNVLLKPKKKKFPDEEVENHAVPELARNKDKTAWYFIYVTLSARLTFKNEGKAFYIRKINAQYPSNSMAKEHLANGIFTRAHVDLLHKIILAYFDHIYPIDISKELPYNWSIFIIKYYGF